ncbi:uncharacterized protein LOC142972635 [Anticarsia gemmatalis]|uniref:uncharacterized protein LOC142972635 n=1 Tax=Anticarsia gemmatalis TaxID=129554 RepID=UPI003F76D98C
MWLHTVFSACVVLFSVHYVLGQMWEFGALSPNLEVIARYEGDFEPSDKIKNIDITVPNCYVLHYIVVVVYPSSRTTSAPLVKFTGSTRTVTIAYKPWETSASAYELIAQGLPFEGCV